MKRHWRQLYRKIPYPNILVIVLCAVFGLLSVGWGLWWQETIPSSTPSAVASLTHEVTVSTIPTLTAPTNTFVVMQADTGAIITELQSRDTAPLASVTKLFAAAAVLEHFSTTSAVVTWADLYAPGEGGLEPNSTMTLYELLFPLLLVSSNDAAATIDRTSAGQIVTAMNDLSHRLELDATFTEPSGYDDGNSGSALAVATFARHLYVTHPHLLDITTLRQYVGSETVWQNNNPFAGDPGYRGGKNGYTISANRTMVAIFDEEFRVSEGVSTTIPLIYVTLGSPDAAAVIRELRSFIRDNALVTETPTLRTRPTEAPLVY